MDFTRATNVNRHRRASLPRWKGVVIGCLVVLGLLVLTVACAPMLLSTARGREFIVHHLNAKLAPATLSIGNLDLAWFSPQTFDQVTYKDAAFGEVHIAQVKLASVWKLLPLGRMDVELLVDRPTLTYAPQAPIAPQPPVPVPSDTQQSAKTPRELILPVLDIGANVEIREATVQMQTLPRPLLSQCNVTLKLAALDAPAYASWQGLLLDAPTNGCLETLPIPRILEQRLFPLANLVAEMNAEALTFSLNAKGLIEAKLKAKSNLPKLLSMLNLLGIDTSAVTVHSGELRVDAAVTQKASQWDVTALLETAQLSGLIEGKPLAFSPKLSFHALVDPAVPLQSEVYGFSLQCPGLTASGSGTLEKGRLQLQADLVRLAALASPFVSLPTLAAPLSATLDLTTVQRDFTLALQAHSEKTEVLSLAANGKAVDPVACTFEALKLNTTTSLAPLTALFPEMGRSLKQLAGKLYLNVALRGSLTQCSGAANVALRDTKVVTTAWNIHAPALLSGSTAFAYADKKVALSDIHLSSPIAELQGAIPSFAPLTATLKGSLTPGDVLAKWRVWGKDEKPLALQGAVDVGMDIAFPRATLALTSKDFTVQPIDTPSLKLPFDFYTQLAVGWGLGVEAFRLETPYLACTASGRYLPDTLQLEGTLTPDFKTIWTLPAFDAYRSDFAITGKHTHPFTFSAPLASGLAGILNEGKASAKLTFDTITAPALDIPGATVEATLSDAVLAVDGNVLVNGGALNLCPRINLATKPYVVTLPDNAVLMDEVALTQKMADTLLKYINPVFSGKITPRGTFGLRAQHFLMTLDDTPLASLNAQMEVSTSAITLAPNGMLKSVLSFVDKEAREVTLKDQSIGVKIEDGILTADELSMRVKSYTLLCAGQTNLATKLIAYDLAVPLKKDPSRRIVVPVRGSINTPNVNLGELARQNASLVSQRLDNKINKKWQKVFGTDAPEAVGDVTEELLGKGAETLDTLLKSLKR